MSKLIADAFGNAYYYNDREAGGVIVAVRGIDSHGRKIVERCDGGMFRMPDTSHANYSHLLAADDRDLEPIGGDDEDAAA